MEVQQTTESKQLKNNTDHQTQLLTMTDMKKYTAIRDSSALKRKLEIKNEDEDSEPEIPSVKVNVKQCPYLDTINRNVLDFDFEKLCSVSLTRINVYACLVCGKYFQGRGSNTHAYTHSVAEYHHVFLNLLSLRFYCLPDNYEIIDSSLDVSVWSTLTALNILN